MLSSAIQNTLRERFVMLNSLPAPLWEQIAAQADTRRYAPDDVLFDGGETCSAYPLLLNGMARIVEISDRGRELTLYRIAAGDLCVISLSAFLGQRAQSARCVADTDIVAVVLPQKLFDALLAQYAPFRAYIFGLFAARMSDLMQTAQAVAFQQLDQRLAALLLAKSAASDTLPPLSYPSISASSTSSSSILRSTPSVLPIVIHTTHQKLADELGSVREIISRLLRRFEAQGMVALSRETIKILDDSGLRAFASVSTS